MLKYFDRQVQHWNIRTEISPREYKIYTVLFRLSIIIFCNKKIFFLNFSRTCPLRHTFCFNMAQIPNRIQFIRSKVHRGLFPAQASAKPNVLWIGCSSSGLQETQELGLSPGEILEHRNIGNMISNEDLSSASSVEYALKVEKVCIPRERAYA